MRTGRNTRRLAAVALASALALTACGGQDEQAETTTELSEEERLAALESELAQLREDGDAPADGEDEDPDGQSDDPDSEDGDGGEQDPDTDDADSARDDDAEPRVFEVGETQISGERGDLEVTVERIVVRDYHIEVELTAVNDHPESTFNLWSGGGHRDPLLFDERDRRFQYQHPAGYRTVDPVRVGPGQRLDAVLMFGQRLHPDAEALTLRFRHGAIEDWEWNVDLAEAER